MSGHGTHSLYSHGCRCDDCRGAHRQYTVERRTKALSEGTLTHGLSSTYDAGCRCEPCMDARRVKYFVGKREYRPRRYTGLSLRQRRGESA